jgi:DNA-binding transcriptional MerR regulator
MPDIAADVEIPNRSLFKAAEVCDILKVQPYVLRTWEAEFPELGVAKTAGGPRIYRRRDVEQVARIKRLLLVDGLTLAGARRKLEEETAPIAADAPVIDELMGQHARERLTTIKRGLRSILELLSANGSGLRIVASPSAAASSSARPRTPSKSAKAPRSKPAPSRHAAARSGSARRRH